MGVPSGRVLKTFRFMGAFRGLGVNWGSGHRVPLWGSKRRGLDESYRVSFEMSSDKVSGIL